MIYKKKFQQDLLENIWFVLFALLTSLSLWFFVTYKGQSETIVEASIEFKNIPKGFEILKQNIKKVNLNIRGHERLIKNLGPADLRVIVDLTNAKQGDITHYFDKDNVALPKTIKVLRIEPNFVKISLDESISRVLQVKPLVIGTPEKGYSVKTVKVLPNSVIVEGPKTEISKIRIVRTESIEIAGLDSDISVNAKLNADGKNVRIEPSEVNVMIGISRSK